MATASLERRLVNPGRRKRRANPKKRLTLKQKLYFGSPRQRTAAKAALHRKRSRTSNPAKKTRKVKAIRTAKKRATATPSRSKGHRKRLRYLGKGPSHKGNKTFRYVLNPKKKTKCWGCGKVFSSVSAFNAHKHFSFSSGKRKTIRKRTKNVGEIVSFGLAGFNPGRKRRRTKNMAKRKRTTHRKRYTHRRRSSNPSLRALLGLTRKRRKSSHRRRRTVNSHRRRAGRRRNPGALMTSGTKVVGIIGGAYLTALLTGVIPAQFSTGIIGYIATAFVAYVQGYLVSRFAHKHELGSSMQLGGYTYLALKILNDFAPNIANMSPFGLRGALARSSFYTPQVTQGNSFTQFVTPGAVMAAMPSPSLRGRTGRTS